MGDIRTKLKVYFNIKLHKSVYCSDIGQFRGKLKLPLILSTCRSVYCSDTGQFKGKLVTLTIYRWYAAESHLIMYKDRLLTNISTDIWSFSLISRIMESVSRLRPAIVRPQNCKQKRSVRCT